MRYWLGFLLAAPIGSAAVIRFLVPQSERIVSKIASLTKLAIAFGTCVAVALWARGGFAPVEINFGDLVRIGEYRFPLLLFLDSVSFTFLVVIALITAVIIRYCRYYLHREEGYARFFMTIFLFVSGMNLIVMAGTLDLLFAGWEIVGISSFLLIAFYRERTLPVRNAFRAYLVYRVCDVGLLLAIWLAHYLWRADSRLSYLSALPAGQVLSVGYLPLLALSLLILLAASGKSAQFPFCFWLPRAMEGPTPSSAIFYGALSIHAGVFLLIRTFPLWHALVTARIIVGTVGVLSTFVSTLSGRTQSNIKGQLAYASITQVGMMLVELAMGLRYLALLHAGANAFLKCYELLVSPSVVAQILRIQGTASAGIRISDWSLERRLPERWRSSFYVFALNEGYLEGALRFLVLKPVQAVAGASHRFLAGPGWLAGAAAILAITSLKSTGGPWSEGLEVSGVAILITLSSLIAIAERESPLRAWDGVGMSATLAGLFPAFVDSSSVGNLWLYFTGVLPAWILGRICLSHLQREAEHGFHLGQFRGMVAAAPVAARWLFVSVLALALFPITPAFVGEDLLLHHCSGAYVWMAGVIAMAFVMNGLTLVRLYSRICMGPCAEPAKAMAHQAPAPSAIGIPNDPEQWEGAAMPMGA